MSYSTGAELIAYAFARGVVITSLEAPILLTKADDWLDLQPILFDADDVPSAIETAEKVCAMIYHAGGDPFAPESERVTSESIDGALSVSYKDSPTVFKQLEALIAPYRKIGFGGSNFPLVRR